MSLDNPARITRLIGVYHASGTIWGELRYWIGARLGSGHCALCDITHGTFREKEEWRRCRDSLAVPVTTVHLDERDPGLVAVTDGRTPCVVADTADRLVILVGADQLEECAGSPEALAMRIVTAARQSDLILG